MTSRARYEQHDGGAWRCLHDDGRPYGECLCRRQHDSIDVARACALRSAWAESLLEDVANPPPGKSWELPEPRPCATCGLPTILHRRLDAPDGVEAPTLSLCLRHAKETEAIAAMLQTDFLSPEKEATP